MTLGAFPNTRLRRNRKCEWSRKLVAENKLSASDLIYPLFVHDGKQGEVEIASMPGVSRLSLERLGEVALEAFNLGIPAIAVFPSIDSSKKNSRATEALNPNNLVCQAIKAAKSAAPKLGVICDVALDPFTDHGHDGLVRESDGYILNDETVEVLCEQAIVQVKAGCDVIAPSDMMDGRVGAVRKALDKAGLTEAQILSYSAKYASAFYGPFRDAIGSSALTGRDKELGFRDKRGYQMDPANTMEALREVGLDIQEGADMVMVKPGMPYLDIVTRVKEEFGIPTFAYQVSGEYAMIKFAAKAGALDEKKCVLESLLAFKRAGADGVLTYFAKDVAKWLRDQ